MKNNIYGFILSISDPRNISPDDFAEYYPIPGEFGNEKNLDKSKISKHFGNLQRFKISDNWSGYISLQADIYFLVESYNKLSINDKEIYLNYFVLMSRDVSLKTQSFIEDKILSKKEYYNLLSAYTIFINSLKKTILNEFKILLNEEIELANEELNKNKNNFKSPISEKTHPPFDTNKFNEQGFELFKYLIENYYFEENTKLTSIKIINIWHYFNNTLNRGNKYRMSITKDVYKEFIFKNYKVKITNVDKIPSYENKHLSLLKDHLIRFESI